MDADDKILARQAIEKYGKFLTLDDLARIVPFDPNNARKTLQLVRIKVAQKNHWGLQEWIMDNGKPNPETLPAKVGSWVVTPKADGSYTLWI